MIDAWLYEEKERLEEENTTLRKRVAELKAALDEIRALARTGLKPDIYPTDDAWQRSKLNSIAWMANKALSEVNHE